MSINFLAIAVAALIPMVLGWIWYHPNVFGTAWMRETGMTEEKRKGANMLVVFGVAFLFAFMLSFIINNLAVHDGMVAGAMFYDTNKTMVPEAGSELAAWHDYYKTNLSADHHNFKHGAFHMTLFGLLILLPVIGTNALYERRGFKYIAITVGFWIISMALMGGLLAAWR